MKNVIFSFLLVVFFLGCSNKEIKVTDGVKTPNLIEYNILLGMNYIEKGDYTNGIKELEKALKKDPKNVIVNRELAFAHSELGDYTKGEYYYKKVLEIEPKDLNSLENLSNLYYYKNRLDLAQVYINKIPEKEKNQSTKKLQGYIYIGKGDLEKAYGVFKKIAPQIQSDYDSKFVKEYLDVLDKTNRKGELYKVLLDNYSLYKNEKEYIKIYTYYLDKTFGERDEAKKVIKRYLVDNPHDSEMAFYLLSLEMLDKNYDESRKIALFIHEEYKHNKSYIAILEELKKHK